MTKKKIIKELLKRQMNQAEYLPLNKEDNGIDLNYLEKVEAQEKQYQRSCNDLAQKLTVFGLLYQNDRQEIKKRIKELERISAEHTDFNRFAKKERKRYCKKIGKLYKGVNKQQLDLEKCHKQIDQLTTMVRLLVKYLDISMSEDMPKIQKKLEKRIEKQCNMTYLPSKDSGIPDVEYREIK